MLMGFLILFSVFVLWPLAAWLQDLLLGAATRRPTASGGVRCFDRDDFETLVEMDIGTDGRLDGRFGG